MTALNKYLFVVFTLSVNILFSQYFEFGWSDKVRYANNKDGFFSEFINTSETYIYALNSNFAKSPVHKNSKLKLIAYNKVSMKEVAAVALKGFPENKALETTFDSLSYFKTIINADRVLVFWKKSIDTDSTKTEEIYVESFKLNLERDKSLRKVFTSVQPVDKMQFLSAPSNLVIIGNKSENVIVGSEIHYLGKKTVFQYAVMNSQLSVATKNEFTLPVKPETEFKGLSSVYEYGSDGNIYIRNKIAYSREEQQKRKINDAKFYLVLSVLNPISQKSMSLNLTGDNLTITDFNYTISGNKTRVYGFFGDLSKDSYGIDKQGIFYAEIDGSTFSESKLNYAYFEKASLSKLFPKSKGGRKKKIPPPTEEELNTRFDIENLFVMEDSSVVLFFTRKYNYKEITSSSDLDGRNIYKTESYCEKNNVSAIRINKQGKIIWTSNIERTITYNGTDIVDVRVIYKFNKFYVVYGSENPDDATTSKNKHPELKDNLEYATFDPVTGRAKKLELLVNEEKTPEKEKKKVNTSTICVYDNNFYFSNKTVKQKTSWTIANVLFFPSIYYSVLSGNTKTGSGELGVICLQEGKPNKKKK